MKKTRKEEHIKPIALFAVPFALSLIRCYHSYFSSLVYQKLVLGTRIGQQLGQVLWTFIQYCYLLLTCVPHTYIYSFVCLLRSTYYFRSVYPEDLAILVPLPHRYHEPATGCTIHCSCWYEPCKGLVRRFFFVVL